MVLGGLLNARHMTLPHSKRSFDKVSTSQSNSRSRSWLKKEGDVRADAVAHTTSGLSAPLRYAGRARAPGRRAAATHSQGAREGRMHRQEARTGPMHSAHVQGALTASRRRQGTRTRAAGGDALSGRTRRAHAQTGCTHKARAQRARTGRTHSEQTPAHYAIALYAIGAPRAKAAAVSVRSCSQASQSQRIIQRIAVQWRHFTNAPGVARAFLLAMMPQREGREYEMEDGGRPFAILPCIRCPWW